MRIDQLPVGASVVNTDTLPINTDGLTKQVSVGHIVNSIREDVYGTPLTANSAAAMTDTTKVYVYTGTTTSTLTNGHWYYYDGSAWADGGIYNSVAFSTDTTLTLSGVPADAAATGIAISTLSNKSIIERRSLLSTDDIDSDAFTVAGQWLLYLNVSPKPNGWPSNYVGRLVVFGSNTQQRALCVQMVFDINRDVYVRYGTGSNGWLAWRCLTETDATLTQSGVAADAQAVGNALSALSATIPSITVNDTELVIAL